MAIKKSASVTPSKPRKVVTKTKTTTTTTKTGTAKKKQPYSNQYGSYNGKNGTTTHAKARKIGIGGKA